jgi:hypothetical protein
MVQEVLGQVQKWIIDVESRAVGKKSSGLIQGITESMHWVYSIESYLRSLDWSSQKVLSQKFSSQLTSWFKQLFHFKEPAENEQEYNSVFPHWNITDGLVAIGQLILHTNFPNILQTGYDKCTYDDRLPLIYCSDNTFGQNVIAKLGLPIACLGVIETRDRDWVGAFEQRILADAKTKFAPMLLLLSTSKDTSDLEQVFKLAEHYKIWVHLHGSNVLSYLVKRPESDQVARSFTLDLTKWIRSPATPYLTIYKKPAKADPSKLKLSGLASLPVELMCFTPWFLTQVIGLPKFTELVNDVCQRAQFILSTIQKYECLNVVPNWSTLSDGQIIVSSITFQYRPPHFKRRESLTEPSPGDMEQPTMQYVDTLNSWLFHIAERDLKSFFPVEFVLTENFGWNVLIDIFKTKKLEPEDEEVIGKILENHMSVLQATVKQKIIFCQLVKDSPELEWIDHESQWAGLGAVRYIPKFNRITKYLPDFANEDGQLPKNATPEPRTPPPAIQRQVFDVKENVDHLNAKIVDKLKSIDSAFSLGEGPSGAWCVQFGMVTLDTDVKELVRLVTATGEEIEESSEFLEKMSELVKKGIEKATEELKRESEDALWEEGILRRVPVFGSFVNWLSPPLKESGVRGRALNLAQGQIETTENIYKYHMQVESFSPASSTRTLSRTQSNQSNN